MLLVVGRVVCYLLQLSERCPCHILFVGMMEFASLEARLGLVPFSLYHSSFLDMTEISLTYTLSLN